MKILLYETIEMPLIINDNMKKEDDGEKILVKMTWKKDSDVMTMWKHCNERMKAEGSTMKWNEGKKWMIEEWKYDMQNQWSM